MQAHPPLILLLAIASLAPARAADDAKTGTPPPAKVEVANVTQDDDENYLGDALNYDHPRRVRRFDSTTSTLDAKLLCLPQGAKLKGRGKVKLSSTADKAATPTIEWLFMVEKAPNLAPCKDLNPTDGRIAAPYDLVVLSNAELTTVPPDRRGWTYGPLLVPYKYQIKGNKEFSPSASLGGYLGYRHESTPSLSLKYIAFLGATSVPVPSTSTDESGKPKTVTNSVAGLSYGLGVLATVKQDFQLGLVLGADRVGKSAGYVNQGKPWIAFSIGFDFSTRRP